MKNYCLVNLNTGKALAKRLSAKDKEIKIIFASKEDLVKIKEYCLDNLHIFESQRLEIISEKDLRLKKFMEDNYYEKKLFNNFEDFKKFMEE